MNERVAQEVVVLAQTWMTVHAGAPAPVLMGSSDPASTKMEVSEVGPTVADTTVVALSAGIVPAHEIRRPMPAGRCRPMWWSLAEAACLSCPVQQVGRQVPVPSVVTGKGVSITTGRRKLVADVEQGCANAGSPASGDRDSRVEGHFGRFPTTVASP